MTEAPFAKDAARKMRKELADLEADQAKATCWGAAVGERGRRIDALRRELARQPNTPNETDTSAEAVERLIAAIPGVRPLNEIYSLQDDTIARIRAIAAERDALLKAQSYTYIGKDGKSVLARDLENQRDALQAKLAKALEALERIAHASDFYSVEANAEDQGADTLAYAHKSTCNIARTAIRAVQENDDG